MSPIIETERAILRPFVPADYEAVYAFGSHPEVNRYTGDIVIQSPEEAEKLIRKIWLNDYQTYGYGRWATIYKADQRLIGFAGLKYLPEIDETDIGYRFLPEYWGQGLATEVSKAIIRYGFEVLKLPRIIGIAMPENIASSRVLEKIGLQFDREDGYMGDNGKYLWYKVERSDFDALTGQ